MEIARWANHRFTLTSSLINSFSNMEIKAACETKDTTTSGEKYVTRKNSKPTEIKMTIPLNAHLGIKDVKKEALAFISEAQSGEKGYFYAGSKKLFAYQLMLVEASVKYKSISKNGTWISADIELLLKQCTKRNGTVYKYKPTPKTSSDSGSDESATTEQPGTEPKTPIIIDMHEATQQSAQQKGGIGGGGRMVMVTELK